MVNREAGRQPPTGGTPLLRFGLPSLPGVVRMLLAPGSASGKHPFCFVCGCGTSCRVCGGCGVGVGVWGCVPLVMLYVRAVFVGGGGCAWVRCLGGGGRWGLGWCRCLWRALWLSAAVVVACYSASLYCVVCSAPLPLYVCAPPVCVVQHCSSVHLCRLCAKTEAPPPVREPEAPSATGPCRAACNAATQDNEQTKTEQCRAPQRTTHKPTAAHS